MIMSEFHFLTIMEMEVKVARNDYLLEVCVYICALEISFVLPIC